MTNADDFKRLRRMVKFLNRGEACHEGEYAIALVPAEMVAGDVDTYGWLKKQAGPTKPDGGTRVTLQSMEEDLVEAKGTVYGWMKKRAVPTPI